MKEWILCLTGVIILTTIFYLIMPSGKTNTLLKGIFSLICILVLIQPIISLKNGEYTKLSLKEIEINLDDEYLSYIHSKRVENLEKDCQNILKKEGLYTENVYFEFEKNSNFEYKIKEIRINLKESVIENENEHINKIDMVRSSISKYFGIEKSTVIFYE